MQDEDDWLVAAGALIGERRFEALAGVTEGAERIAERNGPVDANDDTAPLQDRAPAKRGLNHPRQPIGFADCLVVFESLGFEPDCIEASPEVLFADQSEVERFDRLAEALQCLQQIRDAFAVGRAVGTKQR